MPLRTLNCGLLDSHKDSALKMPLLGQEKSCNAMDESSQYLMPYLLTFSASHCCIHCLTPAIALRLCNNSSIAPLSIATGSSSSALPCRCCATLASRESARRITSSLKGGLGCCGLGAFFALIRHSPCTSCPIQRAPVLS